MEKHVEALQLLDQLAMVTFGDKFDVYVNELTRRLQESIPGWDTFSEQLKANIVSNYLICAAMVANIAALLITREADSTPLSVQDLVKNVSSDN